MIPYNLVIVALVSSFITWYLVYQRKVSSEHWELVDSISKSMLLISKSIDLLTKASELQAQAKDIVKTSKEILEKSK